MNYVAHCLLSRGTKYSITGNLLGDFCKGVKPQRLPEEVYQGLLNHRAVDKFTDTHEIIIPLKQCFSPERRRFSAVAIDVLFDHLLIVHWEHFAQISFPQFTGDVYQLLETSHSLMPDHMAQVMRNMVARDWFASYRTLEGVGLALDRIAQRIRFQNQFAGCVYDIRTHYSMFEEAFLTFFPLLQKHVVEAELEKGTMLFLKD